MKRPLIAFLLANAATLPAMAQDTPYMLPGITLEAESNTTLVQDGYVAISGRQATRVDTPIARIPQSVSVITQDQVEDQAPRTLNEALGYTSGANPNNYGFDTRYDAFFLRGFPAYYNGYFRDGLRQVNAPTAWFKTEPYGLEGVAVLKGPNSSLFGVSGPGGVVNLVTKRPKDTEYAEIRATTGGNDRAEIAADFSGPVSEGSDFSYRLTTLYRDSNTDLEGYKDDKLYVAPALTWDNGTTRATILAEFTRSTTGGTAAFYNSSYGVASDIYNGDPDYNDFDQDQWRIGYEVEHDLSDDLTLRQSFRAARVSSDLEYSGYYALAGSLNRYWGHYREEIETQTLDSGIRWSVATGAFDHEVTAGIDVSRSDYDSSSTLGYVSAAQTAAADLDFAGSQVTEQAGIYVHDQIAWDAWQAFVSARWDHVDTKSTASDGSVTDQTDTGRSGRVALSYDFTGGVMAYGSVSTSFSPNTGFVYDGADDDVGRAAEATQSTQREIGVKYAPEGTNLLLSAALFDIDQRDGVVLDASGEVNRQRQLDLSSRGIELEAQANWDNGWALIASYAHQEVEIDQGATGTDGNELSGTPNDTLSIWAKYDVQAGPMQGLGLGAGLRYVGESYGDDENSITNDDRTFVDLAVSYDLPQAEGVQMQLNVKNVFDLEKQTCTAGYCYNDEGRTWTASISRRF
ncbi:TonB-dependent siderophore receptor [Paracoccus sp. 1_MG-2023]|uniref:TonB-dependent siderophore receptor n=1 Tax=unclassified Paracoccus (in: a-proteobacteria) TaxID=2688777 RepID=UPI001C09899B|nr:MULTISPECIES: TonB-dependent siderophore receptor [unclassified Paracoccus (in: a-proteobacteria)]MBU2958868.1 TonB-dependent siderophore receptor [Paracoccus sp. C2R09]MDO6670000.1 TonB-dependent siderophore receptor [Paracoccus sp. 1_MG-2023]